MFSLVDINGQRLTSCAGNLDDAPVTEPVANGALLTIGGLDDTNANPADSFQRAADGTLPRIEDDELYDLIPFVSTGDPAIVVDTLNPSDDDNIFFAYVFTSVPSAVLPDVSPPGAVDLVGLIDPTLPTIVLTHGLQPVGQDIADLWSGIGDKQAATLIQNILGEDADQVNVVQYVWNEAFQPTGCLGGKLPSVEGYLAAQRNVINAGARLAHLLFDALGPTYAQPMHFIGHSLGTAVNAHAASGLLDALPDVTLVQFTALDRPHHIMGVTSAGVPVSGICGLTQQQESIFGYDENFFASILPISRVGLDLRIDNYYSLEGAGVGDVAKGSQIYNHDELVNSNDVGGRYFEEESAFLVDNNHSGVQQWYRWTVDPNAEVFTVENLFNEDNCTNGTWNKPITFDQSLNPCQQGWHWSLLRNPTVPTFDSFPGFNGEPVNFVPESSFMLTSHQLFGCEIQPEDPEPEDPIAIICRENSSPFAVLAVDIPDDTTHISFEYAFINIGDGDYAAVQLDDRTIWVVSGNSVAEEGEFADSGPIPIGELTGSRRLTVALYGVGEPNAQFEIRNFKMIAAKSAEQQFRPRAMPWLLLLQDD